MRIAAIDIGTNSIHMIVVQIRPDLSFEVIDREKEMVRLGAGGLDGRELTPSAMAAALLTLSRFKRLADSHQVDEITAAATSAVREAENGGDFIAAVRRDIGIRVRVISGTEEARLIHRAAGYGVDMSEGPAAVIDIGGGSVEVTLGTAHRMSMGRSFKAGVIRLTERFVKSDPLSPRDERRLVRYIRKETRDFVREIAARGYTRVVGTSGTILSLGGLAASVSRAGDVRHLRVHAKSLRRLRKRLTSLTLAERQKLPGLDPRRADLAVAGIVLLDTLVTDLDAETITLCDLALREGLVLDYIQKNSAHIRKVEGIPDVRRRSAIELAERCNYHPDHARQVARLALALFDQTRTLHGLGDREREWLEYASLLHDIGMHISYEDHHRHSAYLIRNGGLRGFEPDEMEVVALTARYHRLATPKKSHPEFAALPKRLRRTVKLLGAMLRLAEGLDRSHAQVARNLDVHGAAPPAARSGPLVVRLTTAGDAELELWAASRHAKPLARALDRKLCFEAHGDSDRMDRDTPRHAEQPHDSPLLPRPALRGRGHRRVGKDHAARPAGQMARGVGTSRLRH
jgi:exopolyphosphatase/guanosine-5'-triphosphate,3'-diphosphate pyrophosphatase